MDSVGSERAALLGHSEGAAMAALFPATYPERTPALVLYGSFLAWEWLPFVFASMGRYELRGSSDEPRDRLLAELEQR
jgi:pimeloyl-ACP methyl ester carboxylesterase